MTISSSLNAGVAGLAANASRLATIADNIANSATYGYKRAEAEFSSLVIESGQGTYSAGGVRVSTTRFIDQPGALATTNNATELSVADEIFLPVEIWFCVSTRLLLIVRRFCSATIALVLVRILATWLSPVLRRLPAGFDTSSFRREEPF